VKQQDGWSAPLIVERDRGFVERAKTLHHGLLSLFANLALPRADSGTPNQGFLIP
jgi:hypothetical protein